MTLSKFMCQKGTEIKLIAKKKGKEITSMTPHELLPSRHMKNVIEIIESFFNQLVVGMLV